MIMARSFDMNMMIRSSSLAGPACDLVGGGGRWRPGATGTECRCPGPAASFANGTPVDSTVCVLPPPLGRPLHLVLARVAHGLRTFSASLSASHYSEHGAPARRRVCQPAKLVRIKVLLLPTNKLACR
jgi:hypothetical protein